MSQGASLAVGGFGDRLCCSDGAACPNLVCGGRGHGANLRVAISGAMLFLPQPVGVAPGEKFEGLVEADLSDCQIPATADSGSLGGMNDASNEGSGKDRRQSAVNPESDSLNAAWDDAERELSRQGDVPGQDGQREELNASRTPAARSFDPSTPLIMVETAFLASASSLLWLVNFYFPIGPVLRIFFPIPIALLYLRWGNRAAWMGALVSGLLLSVLMGPPRSLLFIMPFGVMGVVLGMLWRRKAGWTFSIGIGAILGAFGLFFQIWFTSLLLGDDLWLYATTQVTDLIDWLCVQLGILFQPSLLVIQGLILAMVVVNNIVYAFVVHLVAWFLFDRLGNPIPRPPKWVQVLMEYEE